MEDRARKAAKMARAVARARRRREAMRKRRRVRMRCWDWRRRYFWCSYSASLTEGTRGRSVSGREAGGAVRRGGEEEGGGASAASEKRRALMREERCEWEVERGSRRAVFGFDFGAGAGDELVEGGEFGGEEFFDVGADELAGGFGAANFEKFS